MAKVLIVGAGLAGLALATILEEHGVPYEIFERDETRESRRQGWAVALIECLPRLEQLLPPATVEKLGTNSVNYNTGEPDQIGFADGTNGELIARQGGTPHGQPGYYLRVSREGFRNFLLDSSKLNLSWGKAFTHYTEDANGVTAHFKDGSSSKGTLLVGADGAHSHVLDQLIGKSHHRLSYSRWVPIFGQVMLPRNLYEPLRALSNAVLLTSAPGVRLQLGMLHLSEDRSEALYFYALAIVRDDPPKMYEWIDHQSTRQEFFDLAMEEAKVLDPVFTSVLRHGGPEALSVPGLKFLENAPSADWPRERVTALGDAAHAMVPFRGAGANTALLDSCDLGELLVKAWHQHEDLSSVLDQYLSLMVPRGIYNVEASRKVGDNSEVGAKDWAKAFAREMEAS